MYKGLCEGEIKDGRQSYQGTRNPYNTCWCVYCEVIDVITFIIHLITSFCQILLLCAFQSQRYVDVSKTKFFYKKRAFNYTFGLESENLERQFK